MFYAAKKYNGVSYGCMCCKTQSVCGRYNARALNAQVRFAQGHAAYLRQCGVSYGCMCCKTQSVCGRYNARALNAQVRFAQGHAAYLRQCGV